jgi:hypothetical protein
LDRRLGGHHSLSGGCGEETYFLHLPGIESRTPNPWTVTIPTELSRILINKGRGKKYVKIKRQKRNVKRIRESEE